MAKEEIVKKEQSILPAPDAELIKASGVPSLLETIRPAWKNKQLIARVRRLLLVDPSSACQRVFNASIHDLKEKIVVAGLDIAKQAAAQYKLPPVDTAEGVEDYSTANIIDLAYRIGLVSRPEWRRLSRVYEIRRDLEHEDNEYEASVGECIYVFETCCQVVLSRDPIQLLRVKDVKEIVEETVPITPNETLLDDFESAPQPRQEEILRFLISTALDSKHPDIVRENAFKLIKHLEPLTQNPVKLKLHEFFSERIGRKPLDFLHARVAYAAGVFPYLRKSQRIEFFEAFHTQMQAVTPDWRAHAKHGELLRNFREVGGLRFVPDALRKKILEWMALAFIGEPGGYGTWGSRRKVFYSDTAASLIWTMIKDDADLARKELKDLENEKTIKRAIADEHVAARFECLLDLVEK